MKEHILYHTKFTCNFDIIGDVGDLLPATEA